MGVLCQNDNPVLDSPGTQLFWWKNTSFDEVQKVSLGDNKHVVADKWKLAVRIDWWDNQNNNTLSLPFGGHRNLSGQAGELRSSGKRRKKKRELGFGIQGDTSAEV
jgi:hypothetical protein